MRRAAAQGVMLSRRRAGQGFRGNIEMRCGPAARARMEGIRTLGIRRCEVWGCGGGNTPSPPPPPTTTTSTPYTPPPIDPSHNVHLPAPPRCPDRREVNPTTVSAPGQPLTSPQPCSLRQPTAIPPPSLTSRGTTPGFSSRRRTAQISLSGAQRNMSSSSQSTSRGRWLTKPSRCAHP